MVGFWFVNGDAVVELPMKKYMAVPTIARKTSIVNATHSTFRTRLPLFALMYSYKKAKMFLAQIVNNIEISMKCTKQVLINESMEKSY